MQACLDKGKKWVSRNKLLWGHTSFAPSKCLKRRRKGSRSKGKEDDLSIDLPLSSNQNQENETSVSTSSTTCPLCSRSLSSASNLQKHLRTHSDQRPFSCPICDKRFRTKFAKDRHLPTHNPPEKETTERERKGPEGSPLSSSTTPAPTFPCDQCGKSFSSRGVLNRHIQGHADEKTFLCEECGKMFQSQQTMKVHLSTHVVERRFHCGECRMRFKRALDLKRHQLTHEEIQPLPCPLPGCKHQFRRKDNLLRHLQLTHNQTRTEAHETFERCKVSASGEGVESTLPSVSTISCDLVDEQEGQKQVEESKRKRRRGCSSKKGESVPDKPSRKSKAVQGKDKSNPEGSKAVVHEVEINENPQSGDSNGPPTSLVTTEPGSAQANSAEATTTASPKKSVTTSVIRMAKSSSSHLPLKKKHRFSQSDHAPVIRGRSPPREKEGLALNPPIPYPTRDPSPGQEYINYLNSLNNPLPFRVREKYASEHHLAVSREIQYPPADNFQYVGRQDLSDLQISVLPQEPCPTPMTSTSAQFQPIHYTYPSEPTYLDLSVPKSIEAEGIDAGGGTFTELSYYFPQPPEQGYSGQPHIQSLGQQTFLPFDSGEEYRVSSGLPEMQQDPNFGKVQQSSFLLPTEIQNFDQERPSGTTVIKRVAASGLVSHNMDGAEVDKTFVNRDPRKTFLQREILEKQQGSYHQPY